MDAMYSLRSRNDSSDSFAVVSVSGESSPRELQYSSSDQGEYEFDFESESDDDEEQQSEMDNADEWEDVGGDGDSGSFEHDGSSSTLMEPHVQLRHQYFAADDPVGVDECNNNAVSDEPEYESDPELMDECEVAKEPPVPIPAAQSPIIASPTGAAGAANFSSRSNMPLSPSSKSRNAKEALRSFYLLKAKQTEETLKLIVVRPPPPPPPQTVVLPLKAPVRYSAAVQEETIQRENAQKAQAALQQFYLARELAKKTRAALNRSNEAKLIQSQSGRGVLHATEQVPTWDAMQRVLTR